MNLRAVSRKDYMLDTIKEKLRRNLMPANTNVMVREKIKFLSFIIFLALHIQYLLFRSNVGDCRDRIFTFKGGMTA